MVLRTKTKKQIFMFSSLMMCCLSASLLAAAFATEYWFASDSKLIQGNESLGKGSIYFGLFKGVNELTSDIGPYRRHIIYVVCLEGNCMYSCASSKETREDQLQMLLDGETEGLKENCPRETEGAYQPLSMVDSIPSQVKRDVGISKPIYLQNLYQPVLSPESADVVAYKMEGEQKEDFGHLPPEYLKDIPFTESTTQKPTPDELEFMDYGLWVGTIACLSAGLLMAVVGALFAVVNTATTPVEAITGVPGLYLWNSLAALFDILTVILWAVQFHKHLSSNVLLYDSNDGWTTEGMQVFGYSFWLVVVAIFVHVANIAIIAIGTYEPKKKTQLEAPDSKGGNIMLY